ncbi:protease complex subunit PrcB family protein [Nitrosomonas sp.]|uniref:protease complex subunit PrcB family protein n=1 Tax=Nitrosomonas sp. TaxID=42353 RepID=UPI002844CA6C|nr:protease complex subunit PrcB family protein [Nitrosomonas sp.]MDR4515350.1 protease complex subunit PrcB family protein [Nitrosomonas sp.]
MKYSLFRVLLLTVMLMLPISTMAQELPKTYSHVVLNLPFDKISEEPWSKVIDNQEGWSDFYLNLIEENAPDSVASYILPEIDFETFRVVTGGTGIRTNGGHSVSINTAIETNDAVYIEVLVIKPDANCLVTGNITYPSAAIMIRKSDKPINFSAIELTRECHS